MLAVRKFSNPIPLKFKKGLGGRLFLLLCQGRTLPTFILTALIIIDPRLWFSYRKVFCIKSFHKVFVFILLKAFSPRLVNRNLKKNLSEVCFIRLKYYNYYLFNIKINVVFKLFLIFNIFNYYLKKVVLRNLIDINA